jgi:hypothetical protein
MSLANFVHNPKEKRELDPIAKQLAASSKGMPFGNPG